MKRLTIATLAVLLIAGAARRGLVRDIAELAAKIKKEG